MHMASLNSFTSVIRCHWIPLSPPPRPVNCLCPSEKRSEGVFVWFCFPFQGIIMRCSASYHTVPVPSICFLVCCVLERAFSVWTLIKSLGQSFCQLTSFPGSMISIFSGTSGRVFLHCICSKWWFRSYIKNSLQWRTSLI